MKGVDDDAWLTAEGEQVSRYWNRYRLVLVTNTRDFAPAWASGRADQMMLEILQARRRTWRISSGGWNTPRAFARKVWGRDWPNT